MERLEAFEAMLHAVLAKSEAERQEMKALKAQGREKSATYRQFLENRLFYSQLFALYREYGLFDNRRSENDVACVCGGVGGVRGADVDPGEDRHRLFCPGQ